MSRFLNLRLLDLAKENTKNKKDGNFSEITGITSQLDLVESRLAGMSSKEELESEIKDFQTRIDKAKADIETLTKKLEEVSRRDNLQSEINNKRILIANKKEEH